MFSGSLLSTTHDLYTAFSIPLAIPILKAAGGTRMKSKRFLIAFLSMVFWFSGVFTAFAGGEAKPEILSITPETIAQGDMITITGKNLSKNGAKTIVKIDGDRAQHVEVESAEKIKGFVDMAPKPEARKSAGEYERTVVVFVGERQSAPYTLTQLTWGVVVKPRVLVALILYVVIIVLISLKASASVFKSETGQFSLSKVQMAMWTFVFGLAYVVLAAIWKDFLDITDGMFWLMGISSTTAVGAKAIVLKNLEALDSNKPSTLLTDYDKTSEKYRLSLHRCQIALWTLIVLVIYVIDLFGTMHLPNIPNKLLVLMGVSGGTYLGFNYPKPK
jgi:hypothetical protein